MFSDVYDMLKADLSTCSCVSVVFGKSAVVQGYKKIAKISDEQIILLEKSKKKLQICGKFLQISSLSPGEIVVSGKVELVGVCDEKN